MLGIGVNVAVAPAELPAAGSLGKADVEEFLTEVVAALDMRLQEPAAATLTALPVRDALRGRRVRWSGGEGVAAGIDDAGRLVVGEQRLDAGEVHLDLDDGAAGPQAPADVPQVDGHRQLAHGLAGSRRFKRARRRVMRSKRAWSRGVHGRPSSVAERGRQEAEREGREHRAGEPSARASAARAAASRSCR